MISSRLPLKSPTVGLIWAKPIFICGKSDYAERCQRQCLLPELTTCELFAVADSPDGAVAVFADEKASIFRDCNSHWATPDLAIARDETGHEVLVFTAWFPCRMIERYAHYLVAGAFHPVP